jgi:geranylgeranyl pyrophosphate synthase
LIKNTKAQSRAYKLEMNYIKKAKQSLAGLPKNKWNKVLEDLTDYLVKRSS